MTITEVSLSLTLLDGPAGKVFQSGDEGKNLEMRIFRG